MTEPTSNDNPDALLPPPAFSPWDFFYFLQWPARNPYYYYYYYFYY